MATKPLPLSLQGLQEGMTGTPSISEVAEKIAEIGRDRQSYQDSDSHLHLFQADIQC